MRDRPLVKAVTVRVDELTLARLDTVWRRDGVPVSEQLRRAIADWLLGRNVGDPCDVSTQAARQVARRAAPRTPALAQPVPPVEGDPLCRRSGCGHPKSKHFPKGCLAGCVCNETRYRS